MILVSEERPFTVTPDTATGPDGDLSRGAVSPSGGPRLADIIVGHLGDQARQTASAAKARRVVNKGEPGVLDLTPLRQLLAELAAELGKLRARDQIAHALRAAADIIDSQPPQN